MAPSVRKLSLIALLAVAVALPLQLAVGRKKNEIVSSSLDERKRAVHALNRLAFGPRPGDVERVVGMGVDKWIDQQLHPDKISDSALETRLAPLRTLRMSTREMVETFPSPQVIKAVENGKQSMPSDPMKRAVYESQMERMEAKKERKQQATDDVDNSSSAADQQARKREHKLYADLKAQQMLDLAPDQRVKEILRMSPEDRLALTRAIRGNQKDEMLVGMSPAQRETVMALYNPQQVVIGELDQAKLLRAIYSDRQLQEVMTDFWFNHFNVFVGKGLDRYMLTSYERDVIRPHVMGKFEDLLVATAQSPAMLFYLDNWLSVGPSSDFANGIPKNFNRRGRHPRAKARTNTKNKRSGLNENYGRELMELHTLGVNGGYTQKDVTEVARVFTGWTLKQPREGGGFLFEERMHDPGDKIVLGHRIKSGGEREGLEVLHLLAHNPSTAHFICSKLATRFVSDDPPPALVDRMAHTFLKKNGDIREVLKTMFHSPEFWAPEAYRAKVKTPLEFVVSALRASGANVTDATPTAWLLQQMGMPLYGMQPPTGYPMKADNWVNSSALLARMNYALALGSGKMKGVELDSESLLGNNAPSDAQQVISVLEDDFLAGEVSRQTHDVIENQLKDPRISQRKLDDPARPPNVGVLAGLILGSPEFQRR